MKTLEKFISPFTEQMFPEFYRSEGKNFILFVKAYLEWLESEDQVLYEGRRIPEYRDIDKTVSDFIVFFKTKYLNNIQFTTASNKELFIKNSLDFYRAKGTIRSVELFFKLVHGIDAEVYYPGDDLFRTSDNTYNPVKYLEVTHSPSNVNYVGTTVTGTVSGATAFVEKLVRKKANNKFVDVMYITNLEGNFTTDEAVTSTYATQHYPKVIGSLTSISISSAGSGFTVGETVYVEADNGKQGKARVATVSTTTNEAAFTLEDGGFGYDTNSEVLISENTMRGNSAIGFTRFETVTQKLATISFDTANSDFTNTDTIYVYGSGGGNVWSGQIISLTQTTGEANGSMVVNWYANSDFEPANGDTIETTSVSANLAGYTDTSATGNVIATNTSYFGVINVVNSFYTGGLTTGGDSAAETYIDLIPTGSGADFSILTIDDEYTFSEFSDIVGDYTNVVINADSYGLPGDPSADISSNTIANMLTSSNVTVGRISEIGLFNPGSSYTVDPFVVVLEDPIARYEKHDYTLTYSVETGNFATNEKITGGNSTAIGRISSINTSSTPATMVVRRLSIMEDFEVGEIITGEGSGATANLTVVTTYTANGVAGNNAVVTAESSASDGAVGSLEVISSGFGYIDGETITFISTDVSTRTGAGTVSLGRQGIAPGVFKNRKGFLSSDKYLIDSDFYQEFSYQVLTGLPFENYEETLKKVLHVAGTKMFGSFKDSTTAAATITVGEATVETS